MLKLVQRKKGVAGLILAVLLLAILILTVPVTVYGTDGIGQPGDGLNSAPPPGTEQPLTFLESLILVTTLS
jgi:hypothetical protein